MRPQISFFAILFLVLAVKAESNPAYTCFLAKSLIGHWEFNLFTGSQNDSTFNYQRNLNPNPDVHEAVVVLTSPKMTESESGLLFSSDQVSISIDKKKSLVCDFDTADNNQCWAAKVSNLKDVNQDIGPKSVKDLMAAPWVCYGQ